MFSLLFGAKNSSKGVGYGGNKARDLAKRKEGREKAAAQQSTREATKLAFLIRTASLLRHGSLDTDQKNDLVATLKDIFRNQVPSEWSVRKKTLVVALTCFGLMLKNNCSELVGGLQDSESLAFAFDNLAQHAHFLSQHSCGKEHARLVERILALRSTLEGGSYHESKTACDTVDLTMEDSSHVHYYRKTLLPLCFDFCSNFHDHAFSKQSQSNQLDTRKLFQELSAFRTSLPVENGSSIFVRAQEGRMDLLRALIVGPTDTPYANGCFLFDIWLDDYPNKPPKVRFRTTGGGKVVFNPNLYADGKVCLSLLGTWHGPGWVKGESTLLQVLVSIQSLVLVAEPIYNEPGVEPLIRVLGRESKSAITYNANVRRKTLLHAVLPFIHGSAALYPEFLLVMQQHFCLKKQQLQRQLVRWTNDDSSLASIAEEVSTKLSRRSKRTKEWELTEDDDHCVDVSRKRFKFLEERPV